MGLGKESYSIDLKSFRPSEKFLGGWQTKFSVSSRLTESKSESKSLSKSLREPE